MENSYSSYADSGDSTPRSREIDCENQSWDEPQQNYRVKFMCSYGGKIQPRPHDNQLAYFGGETKILAVDRNTKFTGIISKLSAIYDAEISLKYQLPGEDLDALVSVTNDEDLEHMMLEYDRLHRASSKPARLRLFLFPAKSLSAASSLSGKDQKTSTNQQWFVDALNSAQIQQSIDDSSATSPPASDTPSNPDFLFGLDKGVGVGVVVAPTSPVAKVMAPVAAVRDHNYNHNHHQVVVSHHVQGEAPVRMDSGRDDRSIGDEQVVSPAEIQRQIHELQRMQISQEQAVYREDQNLTRGFPGDYYVQKLPENTVPAGGGGGGGGQVQVPLSQVPPPSVSVPAAYWQERHLAAAAGAAPLPQSGTDQPQPQPVYLIQTPTGYYQQPPTVRQVAAGPPGYYTMAPPPQPRDVYREQPVYNVAPPPQAQPRMVAGYPDNVGMGRPSGVTMPDGSYAQVGYDKAGRQVYYTAAPGGVMPSSFQTVTTTAGLAAMDLRQVGGPITTNQDGGKIPLNPKTSQASV